MIRTWTPAWPFRCTRQRPGSRQDHACKQDLSPGAPDPIASLLLHLTANTVTIEYALFKGLNDSDEDAARLMELLSGLPCMINVLAFNPFPGAAFKRPDEKRVYEFRNILLRHGFVAVVRNSRGSDINAACGQLRAQARALTAAKTQL